MRVGIFDLETSSLYANTGIILCCSIKSYIPTDINSILPSPITTIRADQFPSWEKNKSNNKDVVEAIMKGLKNFDILVAHNGQYFDKTFLNSSCIKYGFYPDIRYVKTIDPVMIARRHMRMARNSLVSLIDYFDIEDQKTPIRFQKWLEASLDGSTEAMDEIVHHCEMDIKTLEQVYDRVRCLVQKIDTGGSSF